MTEPMVRTEATPELRREILDAKIDAFQIGMLRDLTPVECPLDHKFTPGLYVRTIFVRAGTLVATKIHKTEHPFVISKGAIAVFCSDDEGERFETHEAPYVGITKPNTRRIIFHIEDTVLSTFHTISEEEAGDVEAIEARIIERRELPWGETAFQMYERALAEEMKKSLPQEGGD